jgi:outer membrane immunogenic protein
MRNKLVSSLAGAAFSFAASGLAFAADMAVKAPPPAPAPVYSWTGFYAGLNAGWGWGKEDTTVNFASAPPTPIEIIFPGPFTFVLVGTPNPVAFQESTKLNGAIGGVQVGYNWQAMSNWILGVEADFQASGQNATGNALQNSITFSGGGNAATFSQAISHNDALLWFGTVRGRVGYAVWSTVMLYGTGGLAYGRLNESVSASFAFTATPTPTSTVPSPLPSANQSFDASVTKTGWTVGGGIEGVVPNTHVTWKAEYLYMDLGTENYTFNSSGLGTISVSTHFTDNIVRVGLNYQFH